MKKDDKLSWGITLLFFGLLFLLKTFDAALPEIVNYAFDTRNFPLIVGFIFLIFHHNRSLGILLITVGIFSRFDYLMQLTDNLSKYIWPGLLIAVSAILLFGIKKGR